jgi:phage tail-like protein
MARTDPYRNFRFLVEIKGVTQAGFNDCSGFGASTDPIEYREGGDPSATRKLPGQTKFNNIVLKWGITDNTDLFDWYTGIVNGIYDARDGSIILQDTEGTEKIRWNFFTAWPTKYSAPELTAKGNDVAIETLELAVERLERAKK